MDNTLSETQGDVSKTSALVLVNCGCLEDRTLPRTSEGRSHWLMADRIDTPHTHGTGCTYSAAITAQLASGVPLSHTVAQAKRYITEAIRTNPGLGGGQGPVNHFAVTRKT